MSRLSLIVAAGAMLALGAGGAEAQATPQPYPPSLQSFTVPVGASVLESFTWSGLITDYASPFALYGFDGTHLTTAALWSQTAPGPIVASDVLIFFPAIAVTGGGTYAIGNFAPGAAIGTSLDGFAGGAFYFWDDADSYHVPVPEVPQDIQGFSVTFDTITTPEPASLARLATGLVGFAVVRRRGTGAA
jgi:hypothetical protein